MAIKIIFRHKIIRYCYYYYCSISRRRNLIFIKTDSIRYKKKTHNIIHAVRIEVHLTLLRQRVVNVNDYKSSRKRVV